MQLLIILKRGVVKFFNVCNQEQKEIETKITIAGSSERKREKILSSIDKGSFLDRLKENNDLDDEDSNKTYSSSKEQVRKELISFTIRFYFLTIAFKSIFRTNLSGTF